MRVELHLLQNFPPANLNRDDTGTPKDCEFGGVRRARISSQCIKRSIRTSPVFADTLSEPIGIRTKRSAEEVARILRETHGRDEIAARELAEVALDELISLGNEGRTKVLYYAAPAELADLAERLDGADADDELLRAVEAVHAVQALGDDATKTDRRAAEKERREARQALKKVLKSVVKDFIDANRDRARSVDIALFGRMLAEEPKLNLEAACQVAHAISTNRVSMEFDYYTAVDDLNPDAETGAGMIGTTGYNSSCFYRYMLVDVEHLATNLSDAEEPSDASYERAVDGVRAFIKAAVAAIPTGKQTSFAAQTRPVLVLAVVRPKTSMPMSLVNAFENPARPRNGKSLVQDSVAKLDEHWREMNDLYGDDDSRAFLAMADSAGHVEHLARVRVENVNALVDGVVSTLREHRLGGEVVA